MKKKRLWYQLDEPENKKRIKAARYWLAQGLFYAHNTERIFKILFELVFFIPIYLLLNNFLNLSPSINIAISFFFSHNINFLVNCAVWETLICDLGYRGAGKANLIAFMKEQRDRLGKYDSIACAFLYGSVARGALHDSSDLDVVFLRKRGAKHIIPSLIVLTKERLYALGHRIPLEMFLADNTSFISRPMVSELLIIVDDKEKMLHTCGRKTQTIEDAEIMNGLA